MIDVSVIIPVYRSQDGLIELHQRWTSVPIVNWWRVKNIFINACLKGNS